MTPNEPQPKHKNHGQNTVTLSRLILFNVTYYAITFSLISGALNDQSSSLGFGLLIIIFWILAAIILITLCVKQIIHTKTKLAKLLIFTATPVIFLSGFIIAGSSREQIVSEKVTELNGIRYRETKYAGDKTSGGLRIEYYKSSSTNDSTKEMWLKDSTWIYLSPSGDTVKKMKYNNDIEFLP